MNLCNLVLEVLFGHGAMWLGNGEVLSLGKKLLTLTGETRAGEKCEGEENSGPSHSETHLHLSLELLFLFANLEMDSTQGRSEKFEKSREVVQSKGQAHQSVRGGAVLSRATGSVLSRCCT